MYDCAGCGEMDGLEYRRWGWRLRTEQSVADILGVSTAETVNNGYGCMDMQPDCE